MMKPLNENHQILIKEVEELRSQLQEANETLHAIRTGQIDALMVSTESGPKLFTLKSADHTYRVFIEKMKEGAVTLNENEIILYSNSQFASMVGLPLSDVTGLPFRKFIPEYCQEEFEALIKSGWKLDSKGEIFLKSSENKVIPVLLSFTSLELDEGTALSIILTDLTIQKETENQLKIQNEQLSQARQEAATLNEELEETVRERTKDLLVSREHFKMLADNIPVIVWTTQPDGQADYFNKQWCEYTGLSPEQSKGSGSQQALHPDDFDPTVQAWASAIKDKSRFYFEYRIRRADGQYRWHLGNGEPLKDDAGDVIAWFGTSTDIEDQKRKLEKKDEFIGVASHELRTPLTSLKGYIELIDYMEDLPENVKSYISKAKISLIKLQRLINELLDASRIKSGKLQFSKSVFNLTDLINQCIDNSSFIYPSHKIKKDLQKDIIVMGNEERIEQVLMNLINNAIKYSPKNKEIIVSAEADQSSATVAVQDFGIGMSEADQQQIFDRFYRVENGNFLTPGLGMGLYIAAEIIKEHDGEIKVESKLDHGSIFYFSLPLPNSV